MTTPPPMPPQDVLLPCPFCGGAGHLQSVDDSHWVECASDNCRVEQFKLRDIPSEAIAAWNTRAARPTADDATVERVARGIHAHHCELAGLTADEADARWRGQSLAERAEYVGEARAALRATRG